MIMDKVNEKTLESISSNQNQNIQTALAVNMKNVDSRRGKGKNPCNPMKIKSIANTVNQFLIFLSFLSCLSNSDIYLIFYPLSFVPCALHIYQIHKQPNIRPLF